MWVCVISTMVLDSFPLQGKLKNHIIYVFGYSSVEKYLVACHAFCKEFNLICFVFIVGLRFYMAKRYENRPRKLG